MQNHDGNARVTALRCILAHFPDLVTFRAGYEAIVGANNLSDVQREVAKYRTCLEEELRRELSEGCGHFAQMAPSFVA